jgi:hypothetical protein
VDIIESNPIFTSYLSGDGDSIAGSYILRIKNLHLFDISAGDLCPKPKLVAL